MKLEELNEHFNLIQQLQELQQTYESMKAKALGAQRITGMPHGTGVSDKVGMLAAELADLAGRIKYMQDTIRKNAAPIEEWTNTIEDERTRIIFRLRFLHGYSWCEVADILDNRITEDAVKMVCYRYLKIVSE